MEQTVNKIEVCVAKLPSALAALRGGAHRIELCDNLHDGGTTPSYGMIKKVRDLVSIDIHVMIRPRGGDFQYSDDEIQLMMEDINICRELGVDGVVLGCLKLDGSINISKTKQLVEYAWPMSVTFHRDFDLTSDPLAAMEDIIDCGVDRILTSGQKNKAIDGCPLINKLVKKANGRIIIMPGSGITEGNILELREQTGATEFHLTGKTIVESPMIYRKKGIQMGSYPDTSPYSLVVTDEDRIRMLVTLVNS
jgi:copper homeostasis protein